MECVILAGNRQQGMHWLTVLEDQGEMWRCRVFLDAGQAYQALCEGYYHACVLCPCPQAAALEARLCSRPPIAPPALVRAGQPIPAGIPPEALLRLPQVTCLSRALFRALTITPGLRAGNFLPDMAALTVVHPPLLWDLRGGLYPLVARRHGLTAANVERSLRTLVESTWNRGDLAALERFFGHTVDPEKGKPTNREFLCQLQQRLTLAARRLL